MSDNNAHEMVYIILINYNSWQDTAECIASLQMLDCSHYKIIIIDNASQDDSVMQLRCKYPDITIVANKENLGFAGGNNVGIDIALKGGADYIWLLNNDTVAHPASLKELTAYAKQFDLALLGGKVYKYGTQQDIWYCGGEINWWKGKSYHVNMHKPDNNVVTKPQKTNIIAGCSMFAKARLFAKYRMDERFFLYLEDTDFCLVLQQAGIPLIFVPGGLIWHKKSASVGKRPYIQMYYVTRNLLYFMQRHAKLRYKIYFYPYYIVRTLLFALKFTLRGLLHTDENKKLTGKAYCRGLQDFFLGKYGKFKE